ncbi:putative methyltransferase C9orf114 [Golovinomyces cichoracearum]|uniref:Putative methyltransferase C9orf114 n=1 Tax=Golovinomyces cichoracearum TaxID=62708 RepID=A0A420J0D7_9PEZI|nr:putative methyltransferase C9orf114 [Golovinomyces cichoracearum]
MPSLLRSFKKRKRISEAKTLTRTPNEKAIDTTKPSAVFQPTKGREWTVSIALPGSVIANAQSHDQKTSLAGHIARALSVFCIDEIVIFSDGNTPDKAIKRHSKQPPVPDQQIELTRNDYTGNSDPNHFLAHLLSYLETPPYLRKELFPLHQNLRTAGTLPSLDLPHHLKSHEWCQYREGITLDGSNEFKTFVEAGLRVPVTVEEQIPPKTRVTLKFRSGAKEANDDPTSEVIFADPVNPYEPRENGGYYWGFHIRRAARLSDVFTECTFNGGYDLTIGTSERGSNIEALFSEEESLNGSFNHLLIVFGGVAGLELAVKNDEEFQRLGVFEAKDIFDRWINICPGQGSRTIRTEEALWIGLAGLKRLFHQEEH